MSTLVLEQGAARQHALRIAMIYLVFGLIWIALSDRAVEWLSSDTRLVSWLQTGKGWFFVAVTCALVYLLVRRQLEQSFSVSRRLVESEARYRELVENAPDAIYVYRDKHVVLVNKACQRLFGASAAEQLLGKSAFELFHPDCHELIRERVRKMVELGEAVPLIEMRITRLDGELLDVEVAALAFADHGVTAIHVVLRDISQRKRTERALQESEERLRLALRAAKQGLFDLNVVTGESVVNDEYATMLGYDPAQFRETNEGWLERVHPDDQEHVKHSFCEYISGEIPEYRVEFRERTSDGGWKWILAIGEVLDCDEEGQPLRMLGTRTDISAEKLARQRIARLSALHAVHSQTNQAIVRATDRNGLFNDVCRIAVEQGGLRMAWIGMLDAAGLELIPRASYGERREYLRKWAHFAVTERGEGREPVERAVRAGMHWVCNGFEQDPETLPWRAAASEAGFRSAAAFPVKQCEHVVGVLGFFSAEAGFFDEEIIDVLKDMAIDIGFALERCELEAARRRGEQRLISLSRQMLSLQEDERRTLARELHDEVGQQLAALKLNLQTVGRDPACRAVQSRLADCLDIVETTLGQIRSRSLDLRPSVLDDLGLVAALQWYAGRQSERAHCTVSVEAASLSQRPSADVETAAFRIVQEAVNNALRHAGAKRVAISARVNEDRMVIKVRDDGCGFDVAQALARGHAGKAMGLLGMQERAGLLSGSLELKSSPGAGTEVIANLPLELAAA